MPGYIFFRPLEGGASLGIGAHPIDLLSIYTENKDRLGKLLAEGRKLAVEQYSNDKELKSLGFKLLESNMTTLDGNPAYKLDYLTKPESELQRITEVVSVKDGMKYEIIFSSVVDEYNHYTPTFQKMINSINITTSMY